MAAKAGAEFFPIPIRQDDLADHFAPAILQSETFCINAHGVAKYLLSRAVRDAGYKVVITGEGSDEILGGYAHFRRDMLLYNQQGQEPAEIAALLEAWRSSIPYRVDCCYLTGQADRSKASNGCWASFHPGLKPSPRARPPCRACSRRDFAQQYGQRESYHALLSDLDIRGQLEDRDPVHVSLYLWSKTLLPNYILAMLGDRMEMAHSIEGRVPFLDHHVVEVIRSQPVNQKIHGMTEKYVLREAVRDVITDTVYRRQKHPFLSPPATLNPNAKLSTMMNDMLRGSVLASLPFFDQKKDRQPTRQPPFHGRSRARRHRSHFNDSDERLRPSRGVSLDGLR